MSPHQDADSATGLSQSIRVLMLTEFFPRSDQVEITGGVEARCHYVTEHLGPGVTVQVVAQRTAGGAWEWASLASLPRRLRFLWSALQEGMKADFDVIEGTNHVIDPLAFLIGTLRGRPVIFYHPDVLLGSWVRDFGRVGLLGEIVERLVLRLPVSRYITTTNSVAAKMVKHGVDGRRIAVIPCGYPRSLVEEIRAAGSPKLYDVCVVNRLVRYKHVDVVVEAVAKLARSRPRMRALVVGQGPDRVRLEHLASRLGVRQQIEFVGFVPAHAEVLTLIARSRVFVSASTVEGFGIVLAEAMGLGVPYIVSDIDVFREVSGDGRGGVLFPPLDVTALASELDALLGDDEAYARHKEAALEQAAGYAWEEIAQRTAGVWRDALRVSGSRTW